MICLSVCHMNHPALGLSHAHTCICYITKHIEQRHTTKQLSLSQCVSFGMALFCVSSSSSSSCKWFGLCFVIWCLIITEASSSSVLEVRARKHHSPTLIKANQSECNLFTGSWVKDDTYPLYQSSNCPVIDPEFNCQTYGRPDTDYLRYSWRPSTCELQRFNGLYFVSKMRGKTVMFVGDSLGRNQWESLICMISAAVSPRSPTKMIRGDPISTFNFLEYGLSVSFYRTPYLVDIDMVQGKRILRLENVSGNANAWKSVDVLSFNSGHWWTHKGDLQGWDYMELGGSLYQDMDRLVAFDKGMRTWAKWVDNNIDHQTTRVFFQGISPVHYNPIEWNSALASKNCYGETIPIGGGIYPGPYPDQMRLLQGVIRDMQTSTYLLDITTLSQLRKDAHPSIYSGNLSPEQRANPNRSADCSHWCLPGLPDTWNQLFYTAMLF